MIIKKLEVYVETSVWNFYFAEDAPEKKAAATELIEDENKYELFVSKAVTDELNACPGLLGEELRRLVKEREPRFLPDVAEIIDIADIYAERGIIPERYYNDALHIAYATYYGIDFLVSYNFKHIVKVKTKAEVAAANAILGYRTPNILSPEELVYDKE